MKYRTNRLRIRLAHSIPSQIPEVILRSRLRPCPRWSGRLPARRVGGQDRHRRRLPLHPGCRHQLDLLWLHPDHLRQSYQLWHLIRLNRSNLERS